MLLSRFFNGELRADGGFASHAPDADYWYQPRGSMSTAGVAVDAEAAQKVSAYYAGVRLLSNDVAKLPLDIFQRLPDGGKTRARNNPLYDLVHTKPNAWQSSFEWRRQGVRSIINRGNWYSRIVPGPRGPVDQLMPLNAERVKPVQLDSGRVTYQVRDQRTNIVTTLSQDQMFHVRGPSDDGVEGKSLLTWARDSIGLAMAQHGYAARLFSQGALHGGVISVPAILNDEASKRMADSWVTSQASWHRPKILEQGATYTESTLTPEDSQMLTSQQFSVTEMARWLGVPPHKIADLSRSTNNNIEHQGLEYVTDSLSPWLVLIEQAILQQLILAPDRYFAEFNVDALMRGDSVARGEFYKSMFAVGAASPNEIRSRENQNNYPDGDQYFVPANMRPIDQPFDAAAASTFNSSSAPPATTSSPKAEAIVIESAARVLRKEVKAVQAAAVKFAADGDAFAQWVTTFYDGHQALVAQTLCLSEDDAAQYCVNQAQQILNGSWMTALESWQQPGYAQALATLAEAI